MQAHSLFKPSSTEDETKINSLIKYVTLGNQAETECFLKVNAHLLLLQTSE